MKKPMVLALGGNALLNKGEKPSYKVQMNNARKAAKSLAPFLAKLDSPFVVTHGNGPQVGDELLRSIYSRREVPPMPLHVLNAETQALIGSMLETAFAGEFARIGRPKKLCTIITHVVVKRESGAFRHPTKPIGPFYTKAELDNELKREKFRFVKEGSMYRRVVPSPIPLEIVELKQIESLLKSGFNVVCCGGGGVPIYKDSGAYEGAEAVIDKDLTTQLLASSIKSDTMIILSNVDYVYDLKRHAPIKHISTRLLKKTINDFEGGTIKPKLEAAANFIDKGGKKAMIGNLFKLEEMIKGKSGTLITK